MFFGNVVAHRHEFGPEELRAFPERVAIYSAERVGGLHSLAHEGMAIGPESVLVIDGRGMSLATEADRDCLRVQLTYMRTTLLILDSLRQFAPGVEENDSTAMAAYISGLQSIAEDLNCAIVLIHHLNKAGSSRGSEAIRDQADFTLSLEATARPEVFRLQPDKWSLTAEPAPKFFRRVSDVVLAYELVAGVEPSVTDELIERLAALNVEGPQRLADLGAALGMDTSDDTQSRQLRRALDRKKSGWCRIERGVYEREPAGQV
jgi:hypothetical protein